MADGLDFDFRGVARLRAALDSIEDDVEVEDSEAVKEVLDEDIVPDIKDRTPYRTGELARSIKRQGLNVRTEKVYAPVIEFGERGRWSGLTEDYGPPPRFFFAGLEEDADGIIESVANAVERRWD